MGGAEQKYVKEAFDTNWIAPVGFHISDFEKKLSKIALNYNIAALSSGTAAIHLALILLGITHGDDVICSSFTFSATVNPIKYLGANPILIDSESDSWNMCPELLELAIKEGIAINKKPKAIIMVHLYGMPAKMDQIMHIANFYDIPVIEDAAEAFGSQYRDNYVGCFGDIATFSFFGNKTITTGEGGMLASNNEALIKRAAHLKSQSVSSAKEYWHDEIGFNFRMTNICAAIGLAQLEGADVVLQKKQKIAQWYQDELAGAGLKFQIAEEGAINSYWMVTIVAESADSRDEIRSFLKAHAVETRPVFYPAHTMPAFFQSECFPVAERLSGRGINLPSFPDLSQDDVVSICNLIKNCLDNSIL